MSIFIGGSGSSGSTVLAYELNKHDDLFCGPELNIFNKKDIITNWSTISKAGIKGLDAQCTHGWFPYPGHNLESSFYGWSRPELEILVQESSTFKDFCNAFFTRTKEIYESSIWVEKTPSNAYCFDSLLNTFGNSKVIHLVRNPYDSVASLVKRGMSEFFATGIWVYNVASAVSSCNSNIERSLTIKYEDMVREQSQVLAKVYEFIGVGLPSPSDTTNKKLQALNELKLSSWTRDPLGGISKPKESTFFTMSEKSQARIIYALAHFSIKTTVCNDRKLKFNNAEQLCGVLGYDFLVPQEKFRNMLRVQRSADYLKRIFKNYPTKLGGYIAEISR